MTSFKTKERRKKHRKEKKREEKVEVKQNLDQSNNESEEVASDLTGFLNNIKKIGNNTSFQIFAALKIFQSLIPFVPNDNSQEEVLKAFQAKDGPKMEQITQNQNSFKNRLMQILQGSKAHAYYFNPEEAGDDDDIKVMDNPDFNDNENQSDPDTKPNTNSDTKPNPDSDSKPDKKSEVKKINKLTPEQKNKLTPEQKNKLIQALTDIIKSIKDTSISGFNDHMSNIADMMTGTLSEISNLIENLDQNEEAKLRSELINGLNNPHHNYGNNKVGELAQKVVNKINTYQTDSIKILNDYFDSMQELIDCDFDKDDPKIEELFKTFKIINENGVPIEVKDISDQNIKEIKEKLKTAINKIKKDVNNMPNDIKSATEAFTFNTGYDTIDNIGNGIINGFYIFSVILKYAPYIILGLLGTATVGSLLKILNWTKDGVSKLFKRNSSSTTDSSSNTTNNSNTSSQQNSNQDQDQNQSTDADTQTTRNNDDDDINIGF